MARRAEIADTLRQRVLSALHHGTLQPGSRLPSARVLGAELDVDARVVTAAFRQLERDGLVERRPGSRAHFVAGARTGQGTAPSSAEWLVDVFMEGLARGVTAPDLPDLARRSLETLRLRAACVESNTDHITWLCAELQEDYDVAAAGVEVEALRGSERLPTAVRDADLLLTTRFHEADVRAVAERLGKPLVVATLRADLIADIERQLASGPVYFIGTDPRLEAKLRLMFANAPADHLRVLLADRDDVGAIPDGSTAYVMRSARGRLAGVPPNVRPLSTLRSFSRETQRDLLRFIVRANSEAMQARR